MSETKKIKFSSVFGDRQQDNKFVDFKEVHIANKDYVYYGYNNKHPEYLLNLYSNCSVLQSILDGTSDYVLGDDIKVGSEYAEDIIINSNGDSLYYVIQKITMDYLIFGGYSLQAIRNINSDITELYWLDFSKVRINKDKDTVYYSDKWGAGNSKAIEYPIFDETSPTSVYYYNGIKTRGVYPLPLYGSSSLSCETQIEIKRFHRAAINNNFVGNIMVNFNNGLPTVDEQKDIEKKLKSKFTGADNAGEILISWSDNKESSTTIERLDSDDFDERYQALNKSSIEDIFISMRAIPTLFGMMSETTGFNTQEFEGAFKLYNKVTVSPIQKLITRTIYKILEKEIDIIPFKINFNDNE